jgi:hypothetical protein
VRDFCGAQGGGGWWYGYWDCSADADGIYRQATDLRLLGQFGSDPINRLSGRREFTTGELWNLEDGRFYTSLWAAGGHANGTLDLGAYARVEQWAVRRWVSTTAGPVTVRGHAGKVMPWGENWGGGVQALIVVDDETVFRTDFDDGGADYAIDVMLKVGSLVDFLIAPDPSIGVVEFTATLISGAGLP